MTRLIWRAAAASYHTYGEIRPRLVGSASCQSNYVTSHPTNQRPLMVTSIAAPTKSSQTVHPHGVATGQQKQCRKPKLPDVTQHKAIV